jgi:hypothetical protein
MRIISPLFLALTSVTAFSPKKMQQRTITVAQKAKLLSEMDNMCIINTANYCLNEECNLEDNEALINRLEEQSEVLQGRLLEMKSSIAAFAPRHLPRFIHQGKLLNEIDTMCIMNVANYCSTTAECSFEDKAALVNRFVEQSQILEGRLADVQSIARQLRASSSNMVLVEERDAESLMQSIQSALSMESKTERLL